MKTFLTILILAITALTLTARPVNLPIDSRKVSLVYLERSDVPFPECRADVTIDGQSRKITSVSVTVGGAEHLIPVDAIGILPVPNISSIGIQAERGRDGETWISLTLEPSEQSKHKETYHIAIVGDRYSHVTKIWDEEETNSSRRHFETLHKQK